VQRFAFALFVGVNISVFAVPCYSDVVPSPAPTVTTLALPRFGYIEPVTRNGDLEAGLADFANDVARALPEALPVAIVRLSGANLRTALKTPVCSSLHLSGFITSAFSRGGGARAVTVEATLGVTDCQGKGFYQTVYTYSEQRDRDATLDGQLDAAQSRAAAGVVSNLADYRDGHKADWNQFIAGSSAPTATPSPSAQPTPSPQPTTT